jgi:hypothetical protein
MITPESLSEQLLFSTVRIECNDNSGNIGTGTGFFFNIPLDNQKHIPVVITNKHVVDGSETGRFQLHEAVNSGGKIKPSGKFFDVSIEQFESRWIPHTNAEIDLCAMLFQPIKDEADKQGKLIFHLSFSDSIILNDSALNELSAVEDILMVGYPIGLWDEANNLPLIRKGITATHPAIDFGGKSIGIVDAACFPGSSGSPVLIVNERMYGRKTATILGSRAILLGVLFAGPQMSAEGEVLIKEIPIVYQPISVMKMMIHLGYYIKAKELLALGNQVKGFLRLGVH